MMELTSKAKILVLFANAYEMKDDAGHSVSGTTVHYLFWGENGEVLLPQSELDKSKSVGQQRAKVSLPYDARVKLQVAPAIYEGTFSMVTGSDGKPVLKLVDVAYYSDVQMQEKHTSGMYVPGMVDPKSK